jgi:protein-arginine kinase activator protein McsA
MQIVKGHSSRWINANFLTEDHFQWQGGYSCFTYSKSAVTNVRRYIENQEQHHRKETLRNEHRRLLEKHEIDYEEEYLFEELKTRPFWGKG